MAKYMAVQLTGFYCIIVLVSKCCIIISYIASVGLDGTVVGTGFDLSSPDVFLCELPKFSSSTSFSIIAQSKFIELA